jgi:hypothetical protein
MHTELSTLPGRHEHPPQSVPTVASHPVRRVGLLDRAALHLGVALIKWGRRPVRTVSRDEAQLAHQAHLAREESERVRTQYEALYLTRIL